jgi:hypothetical protein
MKHLTNALTDRERDLLAFRFANPHLTIRQITSALLLQPGELGHLLRLRKGRELLHALAYDRTDLPWQKYRFSPKLYLRAITAPGK